MPVATSKILNSLISEMNTKVLPFLDTANEQAQAIKARFVAANPGPVEDVFNQGQIDALTTFLADLNSLKTGAVATTLKAKYISSHDGKALPEV